MNHFSKILKHENASKWSFYLSNILGWILTPRSLITPGDVIINIYIQLSNKYILCMHLLT